MDDYDDAYGVVTTRGAYGYDSDDERRRSRREHGEMRRSAKLIDTLEERQAVRESRTFTHKTRTAVKAHRDMLHDRDEAEEGRHRRDTAALRRDTAAYKARNESDVRQRRRRKVRLP